MVQNDQNLLQFLEHFTSEMVSQPVFAGESLERASVRVDTISKYLELEEIKERPVELKEKNDLSEPRKLMVTDFLEKYESMKNDN